MTYTTIIEMVGPYAAICGRRSGDPHFFHGGVPGNYGTPVPLARKHGHAYDEIHEEKVWPLANSRKVARTKQPTMSWAQESYRHSHGDSHSQHRRKIMSLKHQHEIVHFAIATH